MIWLKLALSALAIWGVSSCGTEEDKASSNVTVVVSTSAFPLIPAPAYSAVAERKSATSPDISASYFRIPKITFNRADTSKSLIIAFLRIKIQIPSGLYTCEVGGDNLSALAEQWWTGGREATISAGVDSFSTSRALYCGGISADVAYSASGSMEIFGLERDDTTLEETPVRTSVTISIQSF